MSDRVCIMRYGEIVQVGSPMDLYDRPKNRYVADFVGKSNFFDGVVDRIDGSSLDVRLDSGIKVSQNSNTAADEYNKGDRVCLSVRPEQVILTRDESQLPAARATTISTDHAGRATLTARRGCSGPPPRSSSATRPD